VKDWADARGEARFNEQTNRPAIDGQFGMGKKRSITSGTKVMEIINQTM
jgi:hypothetical protein